MADKRRFIELLPDVHNTETLKKFFGSTVDQVFQPGSSEQLSGYIGSKPPYYDPSKDFYISEPDAVRTAYQLEPAMVSKDEAGNVSEMFTYHDLVNYLTSENAITTDANRLFGDQFYGWAPPIDIDKIQNFRQYYWFGDNPNLVPTLNMRVSRQTYTADGQTYVFAMPAAVAGVDAAREKPVAFVNGVAQDLVVQGQSVALVIVPPAGATVVVFRYSDLTAVVEDNVSFDPRPYVKPVWAAGTQYYQGDAVSYPDYGTVYVCTAAHTAGAAFDPTKFILPHDDVLCPDALSSGMRLGFMDGVLFGQRSGVLDTGCETKVPPTLEFSKFTQPWDDKTRPTTFFVEGVGASTRVVEFPLSMTVTGTAPIYTVIDRRSRDRNPWCVNNFWIHEGAWRWGSASFASRRATRPIVEFIPNIELAFYGTQRRPDVQATVTDGLTYIPVRLDESVDFFKDISDWGILPYDNQPYESSGKIKVALIDANGLPTFQLFADNAHPLRYDDRVLVLHDPVPDLNGAILKVEKATINVVTTVTNPDGSTTTTTTQEDVMVLLPQAAPVKGDVVRNVEGRWIPWDKTAGTEPWYLEHDGLDNAIPYEYTKEPVEYYYDGSWHEAQARHDGLDPRFSLYTANKVRHDLLPQSDFTGNRLFGYNAVTAGDTGAVYDKTLGRYVVNDSGQPIFRNDQVTERTISAGTTVPGFQFYRVVGDAYMADAYSNSWHPTGERSHQSLTANTFSVPMNLFVNPNNDEVETISRNQDLENFANILMRQPGFTGSPYNNNSWRDTPRALGVGYPADSVWKAGATYAVGDRVSYVGVVYTCAVAHTAGTAFAVANFTQRPVHTIAQNRTPLLRTMMLASDDRFDYLDAVRYVDNEYLRFRQKFVQYVLQMHRTGVLPETADPDQWVETALTFLKQAKTPDFAFALSAMAGGQYYIPPTGAGMGILNCYVPGYETDDTYQPAALFLRGHDGSRTAINGSFEDGILLALERRIYNSILPMFRTDTPKAFDFFSLLDGKWRGDVPSTLTGEVNPCDPNPPPEDLGKTTYSPGEFVQLYTPIFLRYAQLNQIDWRTNNTYVPTDPFTWNYHGVKDRDGVELPGNFRAIYRFYFDTDRPHAEPWAMLGFAQKPAWWDDEYGAAPYTSGNRALWEDLRDGVIRQGVRAGIDPRFVRPGLLAVLPVDEEGKLLNPMATGIVPKPPTAAQAAADWQVGDGGPGEQVWRNSVDFPYALCQLGYLMRPAEWVELTWDTVYFGTLDDGQVYNIGTQDRLKASELVVHGETVSTITGERVRLLGIQQWVSDLMASRNQKPELLGRALRGMNVQLVHKMAGFTRTDSLRVFADNSGLIPDEDVTVVLHTSPPYREAVYSGVIVEWTGDGYSVIGYDTTRNGFCVLDGDPNSQTQTIALGTNPVVYEWHPNVYYEKNILVDYRGSTFSCITAHTAGPTFDREFWSPQTVGNKLFPSVTVYTQTDGTRTFVPYGSVFKTIQDVARFLWDYGRALSEAGFIFDYIDPITGTVEDWEAAIRQFLAWAQMDWQPGNFIALSPGASQLKYHTDHGFVLSLESVANGIYGLLDRTGRPIPTNQTFVARLDEETKIITLTNNLFCARLRLAETEHVVLFNNTTIFGDVIYTPLLSLRQPRLRMFGLRTNQWTGRLDAPGYMVEDTTTQPNFWRAAQNLRTMFDIEGSEDTVLRDYSRHLIGYQKRSYLDNLLISETEQFEFFQGMIKSKGAPGVFQKLTRSRIIDDQADLTFLDEWAFKTGSFGATDKFRRVSFSLSRTDMRGNPQLIQFSADGLNDAVVTVPQGSVRWIEEPADVDAVFAPVIDRPDFTGIKSNVTNLYGRKLRTAGPVRTDEVTYSVANPTLYPALFNMLTDQGELFRPNDRIWVYDLNARTLRWDVQRLSLVGGGTAPIIAIETSLDDSFLSSQAIRVVFNGPHGLTQADENSFLVIPQPLYSQEHDYSGFHFITNVESETTLLALFDPDQTVNGGVDLSQSYSTSDLINAYVTQSMRFATTAARDAFQTTYGFGPGELAYVDQAVGHDGWVVYLWTGTAWGVYREQPAKIDSDRMKNARIYGLATAVGTASISPEPLYLGNMVVLDPVLGNICGEAERELTYKMDYDPAQYQRSFFNANTDALAINSPAAWGIEHVGELWFDTSKTYFLETETDILTPDQVTRLDREMDYRSRNWGTIAPGCSVDVWEWTRSLVAPYAGGVANQLIFGDVNQVTEFDEDLGTIVTAYYSWTRNPTVVPANVPGRRNSAAQVASLIANPTSGDISWIAPIAPNAMLVSNAEPYLNDTDTVIQFDLMDDDYDGVVHNEYALVRDGDPESQPPAFLFNLLRNSLTGFDDFVQDVADPTLLDSDKVGATIRSRRSMVADGREGMLAARQSFVRKLNEILARSARLVDQPNTLADITLSTPTFKQLIWNQPDGADWVESPPRGSYDFIVNGLEERTAILSSNDVLAALGFQPFATQGYDESGWDYDFATTTHDLAKQRKPRILMQNYAGQKPGWSIWDVTLRSNQVPVPNYIPPVGKPHAPDFPNPPALNPPVAIDDTYTIAASTGGIQFTISAPTIMGNDFAPDGRAFAVFSVGPLGRGTPGTLTMVRGSTWVYSAPPGIYGEFDIPYTIIDSKGLTSSAVIRLTVPRPAVIAAVDDFFVTVEDTPLTFAAQQLIANDRGSNIKVTSIGQPVLGGTAVLANNTITYTPPTESGASDYFSYTITDDQGNTATGTVHVQITAVPVQAQPQTFTFDVCVLEKITATDDTLTFDVCELEKVTATDDTLTFDVCEKTPLVLKNDAITLDVCDTDTDDGNTGGGPVITPPVIG